MMKKERYTDINNRQKFELMHCNYTELNSTLN